MDPQQSPDRRLDELREENKALKNQNAEFRVQLNKLKKANSKIAKELNKTMKELRDVKERLVLSEEVTVATQRRELQQKGIYENLLAGNDYEKLRPELREEHEYTKLQPGSLCRYSSIFHHYCISLISISRFLLQSFNKYQCSSHEYHDPF